MKTTITLPSTYLEDWGYYSDDFHLTLVADCPLCDCNTYTELYIAEEEAIVEEWGDYEEYEQRVEWKNYTAHCEDCEIDFVAEGGSEIQYADGNSHHGRWTTKEYAKKRKEQQQKA